MATKETRLQRGRRRGRSLAGRALAELRDARHELGISQRTLAAELGISQPQLWRIEANSVDVSLTRIAEMASVLGLEVSLGLHPLGDPVRDRAQQALIGRFRALLSPAWTVTAEAPLPTPGDLRAWDLLLRSAAQLVGADCETRVRDVQALTRRTRLRERDGGVDRILIVLSDTAHNRRLVDELRIALGPNYQTAPRGLVGALRSGRQLLTSGVVLC